MAKYFLIAGESSGDGHAATLMAKIHQREPEAVFVGFGGDKMQQAGCRIIRHLRHMAFMGFAEVISHWKEVRENFRMAHQALLSEQPDVLILIDYPSFNLRIAKFCKHHLPKTKIYYYIPPKVWAWKRRRIHQMARLCDEVWAIFPFEPAFYARYGYTCRYVGNPTAEAVEGFVQSNKKKVQRDHIIAILPGSRSSEITHCLPKMLEAARRFSDYTITVCAAPNISDDFYAPYLREGETLTRETYAAIRQASAAIVNSGTATLETALLDCPQVAVYHLACPRIVGLLRAWIQPILFSIKHFTLVNIISEKEVIKEFIANEFTVDNIFAELQRLLTDEAYKKEMLANYEHLHILFSSK